MVGATLNHAAWYEYAMMFLIVAPFVVAAWDAFSGRSERVPEGRQAASWRDLPTRDDRAAYVHTTDRRGNEKLSKIERASRS